MKPFQKKAPTGKWGSPSNRKPFGRDLLRIEMFRATCSECGNACEVPFKPTGRKPILCNACFKGGGQEDQKRLRGDRRAPRSDSQNDEFKKIHAKLDAILRALS